MSVRIKDNVIIDVIEQYAEQAAFLWTQRDDAVVSADYTLEELAELDERLEAHIDGLRIAGKIGWEVCQEAVEKASEIDEGVIFSAAVIAFESDNSEWIDYILGVRLQNQASFRELVSASGWIKEAAFHRLLPKLLNSNNTDHVRLGVSAAAIRRFDMGDGLRWALEHPDDRVKARALRAVGELKRYDLAQYLTLNYQDSTCEFWSAWSGALLGEYAKLSRLQAVAERASKVQMHALRMILNVADHRSAMAFLKSFSEKENNERGFLQACAIYGDPNLIQVILEFMKNAKFARLAGYAFSSITGLDLVDEKLETELPEGLEAKLNDDPNHEEVDMDADEDLPWPNVAGIETWWKAHQKDFTLGQRYLLGKAFTIEEADRFAGTQIERESLALLFALTEHEAPLMNTKASAVLQYQGKAA